MDWKSLLWCIIGIIGSAITSFIFYQKGITTKKIIYTIKSKTLITSKQSNIKGLKILFQNNLIEDLTSTTISIKSVGKDNIEMSDLANSSPLCIKTTGKFLFEDNIDAALTYNSNLSNQIKLSITEDLSTINLEYEYFKHNDLVTFNLLHTGDLTISGELKKGSITQENSIDKKNISDILYFISLVLGILFIIFLSLVENGMGYFATQGTNLLFNMVLGLILIEAYFNYRDNHCPKK